MLSMRIQLFNSVNNSECMKQHCTPPLRDMVVEKNRDGRKKYFSIFFPFPRKDIIDLSQNQLSSDKLFRFTLQLVMVHSATYVHSVAVHRVLFWTWTQV